MHGGPPIAAIVLRNECPFSVTVTGARTLPNTVLGSKARGMKQVDPSLKTVAVKVLALMIGCIVVPPGPGVKRQAFQDPLPTFAIIFRL